MKSYTIQVPSRCGLVFSPLRLPSFTSPVSFLDAVASSHISGDQNPIHQAKVWQVPLGKDKSAEFKRQQSLFRNWISKESGASFRRKRIVTILGVWLTQTRDVSTLKIVQDTYVRKILQWFGFADACVYSLKRPWRETFREPSVNCYLVSFQASLHAVGQIKIALTLQVIL